MPMLTAQEAADLGIEPRFRYTALIDKIIAANGQFVSIDLATICGPDLTSKQSCVLQAARRRSIRISTSCRKAGVMLARLVVR
jgi:hypothetical protein